MLHLRWLGCAGVLVVAACGGRVARESTDVAQTRTGLDANPCAWALETYVPAALNLADVTFVDRRHGWAVGLPNGPDNTPPPIAATSDGGNTWTTQDSSAIPPAYLHSVSFT